MAAATDLNYSALQDIREEAGQHHLIKTETPTGDADGTNRTFTIGRTYVVDRNYNDVIDVGVVDGDVIVYDDGVAVIVESVNSTTGVIVLASAPVAASKMLVTYAYSAISDAKVTKYRDEAIDFVQRKISGIINFGEWTDAPDSTGVPPIVQTVVRIYAAGLILIRDQGLNTDTENSSKDGYLRLQTAEKILKGYLEDVGSSAGATTRVSVRSHSDGNIFYRNTDLSTWNESVSKDEEFMRKDN